MSNPTSKVIDRFLSWKLPVNFSPDCYISFDLISAKNNNGWPTGTNLFSAEQAREMLAHVLIPDDGEAIDFSSALRALKAGKRVARGGWNGKGMFVYYVPPAAYKAQTGAAKAHFGEDAMVPYNAYLAIKNVDETVSTWVPSVNDCLAEDWMVLP